MKKNVYTGDELAKIKKLEVKILDAIDTVCKKHGIEYFIAYGTALGSERHGGFIPWDDDVDIIMVRDQYRKFLTVAQTELGDEFFVQNYETDVDTLWLYTKVRLNGTTFVEYQNCDSKMHKGIYIDIFPIDAVPNNKTKTLKFYKKIQRINILHNYRVRGRLNSKPEKALDHVRGILKQIIHMLLCILPIKIYCKKYEQLIADIESTCLVYGISGYSCFLDDRNIEWEVSTLFPLRKSYFEGKEYSCVNNIDKYLTSLYGNWKQLPPIENRVGHKPYKFSLGKYTNSI